MNANNVPLLNFGSVYTLLVNKNGDYKKLFCFVWKTEVS